MKANVWYGVNLPIPAPSLPLWLIFYEFYVNHTLRHGVFNLNGVFKHSNSKSEGVFSFKIFSCISLELFDLVVVIVHESFFHMSLCFGSFFVVVIDRGVLMSGEFLEASSNIDWIASTCSQAWVHGCLPHACFTTNLACWTVLGSVLAFFTLMLWSFSL